VLSVNAYKPREKLSAYRITLTTYESMTYHRFGYRRGNGRL